MISALREYQAVEPPERIKEQTDLMIKYGYIKTNISIDTMIDYQFLPSGVRLGNCMGKYGKSLFFT